MGENNNIIYNYYTFIIIYIYIYTCVYNIKSFFKFINFKFVRPRWPDNFENLKMEVMVRAVFKHKSQLHVPSAGGGPVICDLVSDLASFVWPQLTDLTIPFRAEQAVTCMCVLYHSVNVLLRVSNL